MMRSVTLLSLMLLSQALAHGDHKTATTAAPHTHNDKHGDHEEVVERLLVVDAKTNQLNVVDPEKGIVGSFNTIGKVNSVYPGLSGSYFYALHRDANRVTVVHSGLSTVPHGDHNDLQVDAPYILATLNVGAKPTHFFTGEDELAIFNDEDGTIAVFSEELLGKTNDMQFIKSEPDHGSPAVVGDIVLSGLLKQNRVDAYNIDGKFIKTVGECAAVHGQVLRGNTVYFGCKDGVLGVTVNGTSMTTRKWSNPVNAPENARVGTLIANKESTVLYGNFGKGLLHWNANEGMTTATDLGATLLKFAYAHDGKQVVALTADGKLHVLEAASGKILRSQAVLGSIDTSNKEVVRPSLALGDEHVYVTSPTTGEVLVVEIEDLSIHEKIKVGGTPSAIALNEVEGMHH